MRRLPSEPASEMYKRLQYKAQKIIERKIFRFVVTLYVCLLFLLIMFLKTSPLADGIRYRFNGTDCVIQSIDYDYGNGVYFECEGETVMIDSGSSEHSEELLKFIEAEEIEKLDYYLIPNPDEEYLKVFADVMESVDITRVVLSQCDESLYSKYDDLTFANVVQLFKADVFSCFTAGKMQFDIFDFETLTARVSFEDNSFLIYNSCSDETELKIMDSSSFREFDAVISLDGNLPNEELVKTVGQKNIILNRDAVIKTNGANFDVEYENI